MLRRLTRSFAGTSLPHREFDYSHPLFKLTSPELTFSKLKERQSPDLVEPEPRDIFHEEFNAYPYALHEISSEDAAKEPELVEVFSKLYSYLNPELKVEEAKLTPGFNFSKANFSMNSQELQPFKTNYTPVQIRELTEIDTRYVVSRFSPPMLKAFIDETLTKMPIDGSVVPLAAYEEFQEVWDEVRRLSYSFFIGDGAFFSDAERSMYRKALIDMALSGRFADRRQPVIMTHSEKHFFEGVVNWPSSDNSSDVEFMYRPYFNVPAT